MARCEDFPCCGHELGCCPDFDEGGNQLNMKCTCGAVLPVNNRSSICDSCLNRGDEDADPESIDWMERDRHVEDYTDDRDYVDDDRDEDPADYDHYYDEPPEVDHEDRIHPSDYPGVDPYSDD